MDVRVISLASARERNRVKGSNRARATDAIPSTARLTTGRDEVIVRAPQVMSVRVARGDFRVSIVCDGTAATRVPVPLSPPRRLGGHDTMIDHSRYLMGVLALTALLAACGGGAEPGSATNGNVPSGPGAGTAEGTFAQIQRQILTPSCATAGCHVGSTAQGQLVLSADVAYEQLVGVAPSNPSALRDGLRRVTAGKPDSSLLFHKLITPPGHHTADYGNPMPSGTAGLSVGQVEYVRQWIEKGAPKTGTVADASLLADRSRQVSLPFEPLAAPAAGSGIQLRVEPFDVSSSFERELFTYRTLTNGQPIYVNRIETSMRPFSHHFVLYTFDASVPPAVVPQPDAVRDIRAPNGSMIMSNMIAMGYHVFLAGAMSQRTDYTFPAGAALRLPAGAGIDLNVHYANHTSDVVRGEAYVNLHTVSPDKVQRVLSTLNLDNTRLTLPPRTRTTVEKVFTFAAPTNVYALTSHTHARGERFQIRVVGGPRDGELVYENTDWEHPSIVSFPTPIALQAGWGLKSTVVYNNTTDRTISFGLTSEDEMDIIFGYYSL
jgi:hypothetical protein